MDNSSAMGAAIRGPANDLYALLKKKFKLAQKPDPARIYRKAISVELVKTIWQTEKAVNISEFYYPSWIIVEGERIEIESLRDLPRGSKYVFQGTAGQGKSIFLRYLAGKELRLETSIPIFIELMKISETNTLTDLIVQYLTDIGLKCDLSLIADFLQTGYFTLLLDAFDEVRDDLVGDTIVEIEQLMSCNHALTTIITSRPDAEIQKHTAFTVYSLGPLEQSDFQPILEKFYDGRREELHRLIKFLKQEQNRLAQLINTPLLLTLLCLTYNTTNKIPSSPYEFYKNLFVLLSERHDSTKPGFVRTFKSKLSINDMEDLFIAFCFECMRTQSKSIPQSDAILKVKEASKITGIIPSAPSSFLEDCTKNTCLLIKEGFHYQFIHKSVMEYHAASFIACSNSDLKERFYRACIDKFRVYSEELQYLSYIDNDAYDRFYKVPAIKNILDRFEVEDNSFNIDKVEDIHELYLALGNPIHLAGWSSTTKGFLNTDPRFGVREKFTLAIDKFVKEEISIEGNDLTLKSFPSHKFNVSKSTTNWPSGLDRTVMSIDIDLKSNEVWCGFLLSYLMPIFNDLKKELAETENRLELRDKQISDYEF